MSAPIVRCRFGLRVLGCRSLQGKRILHLLIMAILRMPRLAIAVLLLALATLSSTLAYAGYLVVGTVAGYLGMGRFTTGLLLGLLLARVPWVRQGKLRAVGLLPARARRPFLLALLGLAMLSALYQGDWFAAFFPAFAASFLLAYPRLRQALLNRALSSVFGKRPGRPRPGTADDAVIDVEVRERKD